MKRMKRLLWPTLLLGMVFRVAVASADVTCDPANPAQVRLQVSVSGMRTPKGQIVFTVYPDIKVGFLKGKYKLSEQRLLVALPVTHACFVLPKPGYYAVALFGDENDNDHFDLTALGIPAEGYGFSNNPRLYFGPPGIDQVLFPAHPGDNPVSVRMQYYP